MKRIVIILLFSLLMAGCSGSIDTTELTPEEHFDYAMSLFNDEDYQAALTELQSIVLQYPGSTINDDAQYYLGMTHFNRREFLLAAYEFSKLIKDIPASPFIPDAQFNLADSYYQLAPPYPLDQVYSKKAIEEFQAFIDYFPLNLKGEEAEKKIKKLNEILAEKEYYNAVIYEKMDYLNAAIKYFGLVNEIYHDTKYATPALYKKIKILMAKNRTREALRDISIFLAKYPDDENAPELLELETKILSEG